MEDLINIEMVYWMTSVKEDWGNIGLECVRIEIITSITDR